MGEGGGQTNIQTKKKREKETGRDRSLLVILNKGNHTHIYRFTYNILKLRPVCYSRILARYLYFVSY